MKKILLWQILIILMFSFSIPASASESSYRTLKTGDQGTDVMRLKEAMYELGYFSSKKFANTYNATTAERVGQLQKMNGLAPTGIADAVLQELIYSGNCIPADGKAPASVEDGLENAVEGAATAFPERTEDGFLLPGEKEYVYQDEEQGLWMYLTPDLSIEIRRMKDEKAKNIWYECDIHASKASPMQTYVNWREGYKDGFDSFDPIERAKENHTVLYISDDYFGWRMRTDKIPGVVIRDGKIVSEKSISAGSMALPNLDTMALFADGSLKTYANGTHTAQEFLDMGATDVFAFGPILVQDGQPGPLIGNKDYTNYKEPRCALGMIEPYHYFVLSVNGRNEAEARGVKLEWLAEKMLEKGVKEAINLDGGGTSTLLFMGKKLNSTNSDMRRQHSYIYFGTSPLVDK